MSDIVVDAQWKCRNCDEEFDTRGRRDAHQRREHQRFVTTHNQGNQQTTFQRSTTSNDFRCSCGKIFSYSQSLQRHVKTCTHHFLVGGTGVEDMDLHEDEGTLT
jgi:hypothetical protein